MIRSLVLFILCATVGFADLNFSAASVEESTQIRSDSFLIHRSQKPCPPPRPLLSPAIYKISWDIHFSPYAGGEDLLFAHRLVERCQTYLTGKSPIVYSKSSYARMWRLSELILLWLPANYMAMVVQHEVFGHGYRIRDINRGRAEVRGYSFNAPPPYGGGGGATSYRFSEDLTTTEESAISIGGVEATAILAQLTKLKWLGSGRIDPRQSILYLLSQHDLNLYIGSLKTQGTLSGHDIHGYIDALNYTYPDNLLSGARLRSLSWINLADPFTFYAIYSWFHYLSSGKESAIPMIGSCYLPGLRLGLTPFGPEVFFENYFLQKKQPLYVYFKGGHHAKNNYYGLGFYAPYFWIRKKWTLGARLDLWHQPKLLLEPGTIPTTQIDFDQKPSTQDPLYPYSDRHAERFGGAGSLIASYQGESSLGYEVEGGYKSEGFLPGYSLRASPVVRLGCTLIF
ncbi:MAG: hypothetical protein V4487_00145 [Chlamydiota bacterium]